MYYAIPPHSMMTCTTSYQTETKVVKHDYTDVKARVTAYTVSYSDCGKIDGITASGKHVSSGMIAAPRNVPFGTVITIEGKDYVVEDRGSAIVVQNDGTYVIDYYLPTTKQANNWGVHNTTIRIHGVKSTTTEYIKKETKTWKANAYPMKSTTEWRASTCPVKSKQVPQQSKPLAWLQSRLLTTITLCLTVACLKKKLWK